MSSNAKKQAIKDQFVWQDPVLDASGAEVVSPVTLVAVADLRPITMQERVRRYMRLPQFAEDQRMLQDLWADPDFDENLDPDAVPVSPYEDRAREVAARIQSRKAKESAEKAEALAAEERKKYEDWAAKYEQLKQNAASPNPPSSSPGQPDDGEAP